MPSQEDHSFIPPHGHHRALLSHQKAEIVYDLTYRFCGRFLKRGDRTLIIALLLSWLVMGCAAPSPKLNTAVGRVDIAITQAILDRRSSDCVVSCDVTLNNRTGDTVRVNSQFSSVLEDFNLLIYDANYHLTYDLRQAKEAGLWFDHRSPQSLTPKQVPLAPGQTQATITFLVPASAIPFSAAMNTPAPQIKIRLAGHFAHGTAVYPVVSDFTPFTIADSGKAQPTVVAPQHFWNISPR